jgi:hypothetical protein
MVCVSVEFPSLDPASFIVYSCGLMMMASILRLLLIYFELVANLDLALASVFEGLQAVSVYLVTP